MSQLNQPKTIYKIHPYSLKSLFISVYSNRQLIDQMIHREVVGRYRGSFLGVAWSFFNPLLMLCIYTFVFSVIFKARWGTGPTESQTDFALLLFVGMIVFGLFSEVINKAPNQIVGNSNYVKKVIFPLEILPIVSLGASLFHFFVSIVVLVCALILINGYLNWTIVFFPLVIAPLIILILGISWILASLGVYLRDIGQTIGIFTTVLMFMSPVFYPIKSLPEEFQIWMLLNPMTFIIEQSREVIIFGRYPNWSGLLVYLLASLIVALIGFFWFQKTRNGFADVL
jgi:lipopolysaccharide transport system permease protein